MKKDLEKVSVDQNLIEKLYESSHISYDTRTLLLGLMYPKDKLGFWVSKILMLIGTILTLTGIIYFFAFNWVKITPVEKFSLIETGMFACLILANRSTKQNIRKISLLSASIFVGIFMAVFGQIYQTGANSYELFLNWSALIFIWTIISNYAPQWILWLLLTNITFVLWWKQLGFTNETYFMIFKYLILFNSFFLLLREVLVSKKCCEFLKPQWIREIIFVPLILMMSIPIITWVIDWDKAVISVRISGKIGLLGYIIMYYFYRYKLYDKMVVSSIILSMCILLDAFIYRLLGKFVNDRVILMLLMAISTLVIFIFGIDYVMSIIKGKEFKNVKQK